MGENDRLRTFHALPAHVCQKCTTSLPFPSSPSYLQLKPAMASEQCHSNPPLPFLSSPPPFHAHITPSLPSPLPQPCKRHCKCRISLLAIPLPGRKERRENYVSPASPCLAGLENCAPNFPNYFLFFFCTMRGGALSTCQCHAPCFSRGSIVSLSGLVYGNPRVLFFFIILKIPDFGFFYLRNGGRQHMQRVFVSFQDIRSSETRP